MKIYNKFLDEWNPHHLDENKQDTILISECVFKQLNSSGNSIFFVNQNKDDRIDNNQKLELIGMKMTIIVFIMIGMLVVVTLVVLIIRKIKSNDDEQNEHNELFQSILCSYRTIFYKYQSIKK